MQANSQIQAELCHKLVFLQLDGDGLAASNLHQKLALAATGWTSAAAGVKPRLLCSVQHCAAPGHLECGLLESTLNFSVLCFCKHKQEIPSHNCWSMTAGKCRWGDQDGSTVRDSERYFDVLFCHLTDNFQLKFLNLLLEPAGTVLLVRRLEKRRLWLFLSEHGVH